MVVGSALTNPVRVLVVTKTATTLNVPTAGDAVYEAAAVLDPAEFPEPDVTRTGAAISPRYGEVSSQITSPETKYGTDNAVDIFKQVVNVFVGKLD